MLVSAPYVLCAQKLAREALETWTLPSLVSFFLCLNTKFSSSVVLDTTASLRPGTIQVSPSSLTKTSFGNLCNKRCSEWPWLCSSSQPRNEFCLLSTIRLILYSHRHTLKQRKHAVRNAKNHCKGYTFVRRGRTWIFLLINCMFNY